MLIIAGEFAALLTTETLPVTLPPPAGVKATIKFVDCPPSRVIGGVRPLVLKPGPETWTWEMLTLELPELVRVTVCVLLPTVTFPKLRLVGLVVSCKVAATPVRLSASVVGELGASLTSDRLPDHARAQRHRRGCYFAAYNQPNQPQFRECDRGKQHTNSYPHQLWQL